MAFQLFSGKATIEWYPKATSQVFSNGDLTYWNGSGALIPADSTSGDHAGVILRDVLSTDSDYATAGVKVPIILCKQDSVFLVDVGTGTGATTQIGNFYDLTNAGSIDLTGTSKKAVLIRDFVSTTRMLCKVNSMAVNKDVVTT